MQFNKLSSESPILYFTYHRGHRLKFLNYDTFVSLVIEFIFACNAENPDSNCLQKYMSTGSQNEKG